MSQTGWLDGLVENVRLGSVQLQAADATHSPVPTAASILEQDTTGDTRDWTAGVIRGRRPSSLAAFICTAAAAADQTKPAARIGTLTMSVI